MSNEECRPFRIWIVSGPSGSGKTTLCEAVLKDKAFKNRLLRSVSVTTRALRPGEREGRDYHHVSERKFLSLIRRKALLEYENIFGFYYGTPKQIIVDAQAAGKDVLLCVDVKGAQTIRKFFGKKATSIFIKTPHLKTLSERLKKRCTEDKKEIEKRLKRVKIELSYSKKYDHVVVNDHIDKALEKLKSLLT
jgi:guanylate kinase